MPGLVEGAVLEHGVQDVGAAAGEADEGCVVALEWAPSDFRVVLAGFVAGCGGAVAVLGQMYPACQC